MAANLRRLVVLGPSGTIVPGSSHDYRQAANRDLRVVVPAVLLVILLTLTILLRALIAPLFLIGSVILSFFGILGISLVFFTQVLDETGFDQIGRAHV